MFYYNLLWFYWFISLFMVSTAVLVFVLFFNVTIVLSLNLFSFWNLNFLISFLLDWMSLSFSSVVLLISSVIAIYAYSYMAPNSKSHIFMWLLFMFVLAMLMVILMSSLFFVMLGWDGLGVVSFCLIVFYQNTNSISSGMFTMLMNRLGDGFFILSLVLLYYEASDFANLNSVSISGVTVALLTIAFMTKSAIYPFSSWLPLAMSAPTPISALVHSSTLVTAGLYLMMRNSQFLFSYPEMMQLLSFFCLFTSFYAGLNSLFESDFKKLIALSTLSHLGFIGLAFANGMLVLSFFHLLTHAIFKSLLFMSIGDIMMALAHFQDSRYLSQGATLTPFSSLFMSVSVINLLGIPNSSGFFSKDLILEGFNYTPSSLFLVLVLYLNVVFTYLYSFKLFYFNYQTIKGNSYSSFYSVNLLHAALMAFLSLFASLATSMFYTFYSYLIFETLTPLVKFIPFFMSCFIFILILSILNIKLFNNKLMLDSASSMLFLSKLAYSHMSKNYFKVVFYSVKTLELGSFWKLMNLDIPMWGFNMGKLFTKFSQVLVLMLVVVGVLMLSLFLFN